MPLIPLPVVGLGFIVIKTLNLSSYGVSGHLGREIALTTNEFSGAISSGLRNCSHLEYLDLSLNQLGGEIQSLMSLRNLDVFELRCKWCNWCSSRFVTSNINKMI
ncbi:Leucine-rich repeat receptor-like protein kinase PEPR2, partial [Cucurbita argyrosperma subsp. sororia]